jgi:hypothetical protein
LPPCDTFLTEKVRHGVWIYSVPENW